MTQYLKTDERVNRDALSHAGAVETRMIGRDVDARLTLPKGKVGEPYFAAVQVTSGTAPFRFMEEFFPKNCGLSWDRDSGTLSGIPTRALQATGLMVVITDSWQIENCVLRGMTLVIEP